MDMWSSPGLEYPEYPAGSVVELRVHGVGGEPPSVMTRDPHPVRVAGDDVIGVFRARDPVVGTLGKTPNASLHVREVVSWGGQTSGTWRHALWVLLLPFAMFNVAGRMHLPGDRGRRHRMVCRLLGLTMTLTTIGLACTIGMDLVATQYVANWPQDPPFWVVPFRAYVDDPVGALALAAVLPSLVLIMLWVASRYQHRRATGLIDAEPTEDEAVRLTDPTFWATQWATSRLRGLHVTAGTAWITGALAVAVSATPDASATLSVLVAAEAIVVAAALVIAARPRLLREERVPGIDWLLFAMRLAALAPLGWMLGAWLPTDGMVAWIAAARLSPLQVVASVVALGALVAMVDAGRRPVVRAGLLAVGIALVVAAWATPWLGAPAWPAAAWLGVAGGVMVAVWAVVVWPGTGASHEDAPATVAASRGPDLRGWPSVLLVVGGALAGIAVPQALALGTAWSLGAPWGSAALVGALLGERLADSTTWVVAVAPHLPLVLLGLAQAVLIAWLAAESITRGPQATREGAEPVVGASQVDDGRAIPWHAGAVVLAMLSLFVLVAVGAGLHGLVADLLGDRVIGASLVGQDTVGPVDLVGDPPIVVVPWLVWAAKVMVGILVVAPLWAGVYVWRRLVPPTSGRVGQHMHDSWEAFGAQGGPGDLDPDDVSSIARLWNTQWFLRHAGTVLVTGVVGGVLVLAMVVVSMAEGSLGGLRLAWLDGASMALVALLPLLGFGLVRSSLSARATRRQIGRLWDVLTFWPRVTHPFAPPCYAETLVPAIADRASRIVTGSWPAHEPPRSPSSVILAGHSQGSIVSLAAAAQLSPTVAADVALVSYGSPVAILYERMFREAFADESGPDGHEATMRWVAAKVHSWHHLTCMTEPFAMPFWHVDGVDADTESVRNGWPVMLALPFATVAGPAGEDPCPVCAPGGPRAGDFLIRDPLGWDLAAAGGRLLPAQGHSSYRGSPDVDAHMASIAAALDAGDGATPDAA